MAGCVSGHIEISEGRLCAPDDAHNGYQFVQARGVAILDTKGSPCGDVGLVAVIPVGMGWVGYLIKAIFIQSISKFFPQIFRKLPVVGVFSNYDSSSWHHPTEGG